MGQSAICQAGAGAALAGNHFIHQGKHLSQADDFQELLKCIFLPITVVLLLYCYTGLQSKVFSFAADLYNCFNRLLLGQDYIQQSGDFIFSFPVCLFQRYLRYGFQH